MHPKTLSSTDIQQFRSRLEAERQETIRFLAELESDRQSVALDGPHDVADLCVTNVARESLFERSSQKNRLLNLINTALRRIDSGQFGICSECGEPINRKRLEAMPWTSYCLRCQQELEQCQPSRSPTLVEVGE